MDVCPIHVLIIHLWVHKCVCLILCADSLVWQKSVVSTADVCVKIENLIPGGHYQFRVSASNPWGISPPSEPSNMVTLPSTGEDNQIKQKCFTKVTYLPFSYAFRQI